MEVWNIKQKQTQSWNHLRPKVISGLGRQPHIPNFISFIIHWVVFWVDIEKRSFEALGTWENGINLCKKCRQKMASFTNFPLIVW